MPLVLIESFATKGLWTWIHRAFWVTALAFAVVCEPIDRCLWTLYHTVLGPAANVIAMMEAT